MSAQHLKAIRTEDVRWLLAQVADKASLLQSAKAYRLLHVILNTAIEDDRIVQKPYKIRGTGVERTTERPFIDADLVLALTANIDERYCALALLAGFGGLRLGELLGLRVRTSTSSVRPSPSRCRPSSSSGGSASPPRPRPTPVGASSTSRPRSPPLSQCTSALLLFQPGRLGVHRAELGRAAAGHLLQGVGKARKRPGSERSTSMIYGTLPALWPPRAAPRCASSWAGSVTPTPAAAQRYQHARLAATSSSPSPWREFWPSGKR
jgi:hypothetical protein